MTDLRAATNGGPDPPGVRLTPAAIEPVLREIERRGVPVGVAGRILVDRVLRHDHVWTVVSLSDLLAALFARTPAERVAVQQAVAAFAPAAPPRPAPEAGSAPQPVKPSATEEERSPPPAPAERPWRPRLLRAPWRALAAGLLAALAAPVDVGELARSVSLLHFPRIPLPGALDELCPPRVLHALGEYRVPIGAPSAVPAPIESLRSATPALAIAVAALAVAGLLAFVTWRRTRLPPPAPPPLKDGDPVFAWTVRPFTEPLLTRDERARLASGAGRYVSEEEGEALDLRATVAATARRGGVPTLRFERRRLEREIWLLEDTDPDEPLVAPLVGEIERLLGAEGIPCRRFRFHAVPDRLTGDRGRRVDLDDLDDRAQHAVVVVATGGALLAADRLPPGAAAALRRLASWPRACVVDAARSDGGVGALLAELRLRVLLPEQLPAWIEEPDADPRKSPAPPEGSLLRWAALCGLGPLPLGWQDALRLLADWQRERAGDRRLRALHLPALLRRSVRRDRIALPAELRRLERARLLWGSRGLAEWGAGWWHRLLDAEAAARREREARWDESAAGQACKVVRAMIDIEVGRRGTNAIQTLGSLRQGGLRQRIDAWWARRALRGEKGEEDAEELPVARGDLSPEEQVLLANTPIQRREPLPRGLKWPRRAVAACAAATGIGLAGLVVAAQASFSRSQVMATGGAVLELVMIPGGTFCMGSPEDERGRFDDESPRHLVRLDDFALAKTETTVGQLRAWLAQGGKVESPPADERDPMLPATDVSWDEARAFCRAHGLDLPTEAQWEYAARAGTTTRFSFGNDDADLDRFAWYQTNSGGDAHPIGGKLPNSLGLHDMHGNVWEWVQDVYSSSYKVENRQLALENPAFSPESTSPLEGDRVVRGGSFLVGPGGLRSAYRVRGWTGARSWDLGFRCAGGARPQP